MLRQITFFRVLVQGPAANGPVQSRPCQQSGGHPEHAADHAARKLQQALAQGCAAPGGGVQPGPIQPTSNPPSKPISV